MGGVERVTGGGEAGVESAVGGGVMSVMARGGVQWMAGRSDKKCVERSEGSRLKCVEERCATPLLAAGCGAGDAAMRREQS